MKNKIKYSFFTYPKWYRRIYNRLNDGDIFIEIGTWTGASSLFFAELIKNGDKDIKFYTIDTFEGSKEHHEHKEYSELFNNDGLYKYYMEARKPLEKYITVLRMDSQDNKTAALFNDKSVSAIFIDGDHSHEGVLNDLENWYPKIKDKGIISGHDYIWGAKGVKPIVDNFSHNKAKQIKGDVWYYEKTGTNK